MMCGSDIVTCWCYTEFYVVIMQISWPCLILISVQDFHDLLLTQLSSPINLRSFDNYFASFENSSTRPNTGLIPQICKTQNSKYRAISIIGSSKRQTDWISELMCLDLFEPQSSGTIPTAWSCKPCNISGIGSSGIWVRSANPTSSDLLAAPSVSIQRYFKRRKEIL